MAGVVFGGGLAHVRLIPREDLKIEETKLAEGSHGEVYSANWSVAGKIVPVVVKALNISSVRADPTLMISFEREIQALAFLNHPSIVLVNGVCEYPVEGALSLVEELVPGGSLRKLYANKFQGPIPYLSVARIILILAMAVEYTHAAGLSHNDIKADNIMIKSLANTDSELQALLDSPDAIKLADYGLVRRTRNVAVINPTPVGHFTNILGTARWVAPENCDPDRVGYGKSAADVFSVAMVALELQSGNVPMSSEKEFWAVLTAMDKGGRPEFPPGTDTDLVKLMARCWAHDPSARPTAEALVDELMAMDNLKTARAAVI